MVDAAAAERIRERSSHRVGDLFAVWSPENASDRLEGRIHQKMTAARARWMPKAEKVSAASGCVCA